MMIFKTVHGIVRGKTIELDEEIGIAEGQQVEVQVKAVTQADHWGEGLQRSAGALADVWTVEDDQILQQIHEDRKRNGRREIPQ